MIEGVDYSSTANSDWAGLAQSLKAAGKQFVGRYAVNDKSPGGRGIGADEYAAMVAAGVDVFLYWESSEGWMTGGYIAGQQAAQNARANIAGAGMPVNTPVYFACDFDAAPSDQAAIDDCLRGAASVLGFERVGLYAGYHVLLRSKQNGTARWFCQTSAWSGGMLMEGVHLYQYDYNKYVYGTNCDWVRAYQENYGQAIPPAPPDPPKPPKPSPYHKPSVPDWLANDDHRQVEYINKTPVYPLQLVYTALEDTPRKQATGTNKKLVGPDIKAGEVFQAGRVYRSGGRTWVKTPAGTVVAAASLTPAVTVGSTGKITVTHPRR